MDFDLAPAIAEALHSAVDRSDTGYRWPGELPEAVGEFMLRHFGWQVDPGHVTVLPDVLTGMAEAIRAVSVDGESVVITPPIYPPFFHVTQRIARRGVVEVPLADDALDLDRLAHAFARPEVTAFLMCHPHNPTGYVADPQTLAAVARLARSHGVRVISDEIWSSLTWGEEPFVPYLSIDAELTAPDIALVSAAKAFNLAGLKCAQVIAGGSKTAAMLRESIPIETTYGTGHLGVLASLAAYRDADAWLAHTVAVIAGNIGVLQRQLAAHLPQAGFHAPQATYLAWLDCRRLGLGDDPADAFLARGRVAVNGGRLYGDVGRGFVRVNVATEPDVVVEIVRRMAQAVDSSE